VELLTKILVNIKPGIYPARKGTRAVATDHTSTPTTRTFLKKNEIIVNKKGRFDNVLLII
jgi:hypothetical protein